MTSAVFASYVEEFESICAATGRAIAQLRSEDDLSSRKALQVTAESELRKADDLMLQMDLEARSTPKAEARALQTKAKACRSEVSALRASLKQAICTPVHTADSSHLGGSSGDEMADTNDQRARLLRMGERIHEGTSKLQQAHKTALEAEQIGISIMGDLHSQRQTITHAAGTLQRANEGLLRSKRTLATIGRRALANRLLMWLLIGFLMCAIGVLAYFQIFGVGGGRGSGDAARVRS